MRLIAHTNDFTFVKSTSVGRLLTISYKSSCYIVITEDKLAPNRTVVWTTGAIWWFDTSLEWVEIPRRLLWPTRLAALRANTVNSFVWSEQGLWRSRVLRTWMSFRRSRTLVGDKRGTELSFTENFVNAKHSHSLHKVYVTFATQCGSCTKRAGQRSGGGRSREM